MSATLMTNPTGRIESYRDRFGLRYSMFKKAGKGLPPGLQTAFVAGNGIIRARMAEGVMRNPGGNLANVMLLMGSRKHPYYEPPCFIAAASNSWNWRNSWFYAVRHGRNGSWRTLDENGTREVSVSYVLGAAVTKTVSAGAALDVLMYTFAPPGRAGVVQIMDVCARKDLTNVSVMAHLNPLMPSRPYHNGYSIRESFLQEEADGDTVEFYGRAGSAAEFSDYRYGLRLAFGSVAKPAAYGAGQILLNEKAYRTAYSPRDGAVWNCSGNRQAGPGNVYSSQRYDLGTLKKGEARRLVFAAALAHGQPEVRKELASILNSNPETLLQESISDWRKQIGYSGPSSEFEARLQLGFISLGLHRAANGGIEESDGEWGPAVYARDAYWGLKAFYIPYGNLPLRMKWIREMILFVHRGWKRYGICNCYFLNEDEPALRWPYTFTEYPSKYVLIVTDYVQHTGDWATVSSVWPMLLDCVKVQIENHLLKGVAPLDIDSHIYWSRLARQFPKADVKFRMNSAMLLASALEFMATAAVQLGKPAAYFTRHLNLLQRTIEKNLHPAPDGVYAAIRFKDDRLMHLPGVDWAKQIWLGNIRGRPAENSMKILEKLPERIVRSPFDRDIQLILDRPATKERQNQDEPAAVRMVGQTWAYLIESALRTGRSAEAVRWAGQALKLVSPSGGLAAHYEVTGTELSCVSDYNFFWSGVLFRGVLDCICRLEPLEMGIAHGVRLTAHAADGLLNAGESIGDADNFRIQRTDPDKFLLRSGYLARQFGRKVKICSAGITETRPASSLRDGIIIKTGDSVEIRPADNPAGRGFIK